MGLARSASYDFLTALTIEGQFVPQRTDLHSAILPLTRSQGCCLLKLTLQLELTLPLRCPLVPIPQKLGTTEFGRRPRPSTALDVWPMVKPNHAAAYVFPPSSVRPSLRSHAASQRRRNPGAAISSDSTPRSNARPMTTSITRRKLASLIVCHPYARPLSPLSDAKCPTVQRTANPSIINPRRCTSPRRPSVYQKRTAGSRNWKL